MPEEAGRAGGLLDSLRNLARTFLAAVQTRLEIVASEFEEERARLARIALLAAVAAFSLGLAGLLAVLFLVVLFWDSNRLLVIAVIAGMFLAVGVSAYLLLRAALAERPRLLSATLAELRKDRDELGEK